jgi:ubiquinone/menaquinone biosynthesis C-methylase UbiE
LQQLPKTEAFELYAGDYDAWYDTHPMAYESELLALKSICPRTGRGLEIGVGTGRFALPLGISVGVDPCLNMVALARSRGLQIVVGTAEALPIRESSQDWALMVTTICMLDSVPMAFREVHRVLRPAGSLIVGFLDGLSPLGKLYEQHKQESRFYRTAHFYSVPEVLAFLTEADFAVADIGQTMFQLPEMIKAVETVKPGWGEGSFVVIKARRNSSEF